jgi:signal transduction histidine kinase
MAASATFAWVLADFKRLDDLGRYDADRAAVRAAQTLMAWDADPTRPISDQRMGPWRDVLKVGPGIPFQKSSPHLTAVLRARFPDLQINAGKADPQGCYPGAPARLVVERPCWLVAANKGGASLSLLIGSPPPATGAPVVLDPLYLGVLTIAAALLALLVAQAAMHPLRSLSDAAEELGDDLARRPLPESGPTELRRAAVAFNAMQARLQRQLAERTYMLSAITHDLQTPATRLRLRLEKVEDADLRERLLSDLNAMQTLIREGLGFARADVRAEDRVRVDLQSLVESLVEDAADAGQDVSLDGHCDADLKLFPDALKRCLTNLIDNALKYGDVAKVSIGDQDGAPVIRIRDRGPGLPEEVLDSVFEPFFRVETSRSRDTGGVGLGLTIARTLAARNGASIALRNHPEGGVEAIVRVDAAKIAVLEKG